MTDPIAYVIQRPIIRRDGAPARDFSAAEEFGEVRSLLAATAVPSPAGFAELRRGLAAYRAGVDHLVCVGHPVFIGIAVALVAGRGPLSLLVWNGRERAYHRVEVDLARLTTEEKEDA